MQDIHETARASSPKPFSSLPLLSGGDTWRAHNLELRQRRLQFCDRAAREPHDAVRLRLPAGNGMIALSPRMIEDLLVTRVADFEKSAMMTFTLSPLAGEGLFTSSGELWKRQRKVMAPLFTPAAIDRYAAAMVDCTDRVVSGWKDGERIDLARETTRIAMSIAGRALFDTDTMEETDEIGHALTIALRWASDMSGTWFSIAHIMARYQMERLRERTHGVPQLVATRMRDRLERPLFFPGSEGRALKKAMGVLDRQVQKMIDDRRAAGESRNDLLSKLLTAHDEGAPEKRMSDRQVRDEVLTLFVAGHETTASGLAWTVTKLLKAPELYARVKKEALAVGRAPTVADLPNLGFSLRSFKEALRLYPPVYIFGRTSQRDTELGGVAVPKWSHVLMSPYATHRRAAEWPNPHAFDPERFLPEVEAKRPRHAWFPFGAGPRICIGNHFALLEAQLVLAVMFSQCDFELQGAVVPDPSATLRAKSVPVVVRRKKPN